MRKFTTTAAFLAAAVLAPAVALGSGVGTNIVDNGDFETGALSPWEGLPDNLTGVRPNDGTVATVNPDGDDFFGYMENGAPLPVGPAAGAPTSDIEEFLHLDPGTLDTLASVDGDTTVEGAAIRQEVNAKAGQVLSFDWNFLTNELSPELEGDPQNDFSFVSLAPKSGTTELADTQSPLFLLDLASPEFAAETGWSQYSHVFSQSGEFVLGFGVMDVNDEFVDSALGVDNVSIVPSPAGAATGLIVFGLLGWSTGGRRMRHQRMPSA